MMPALRKIPALIRGALPRGFARRDEGSISIEAMIILPVMFWTFLAMFSIFETFRTYGITQKAAFTISDAISRETLPIDDEFLDGAHDLFEYLSLSNGASSIRVSSLYYDAPNDRFWRDWSQVRGGATPLSNSDVETWTDRLPVMPNNERILLVETWTTYDPVFRTGLERQNIGNFVFTRPRYAPRVCWEFCD